MEGGTGSKSESIDHPVFRPDRYEAGTINLHGISGLRGGLDHIEENGLGGEHKRHLTKMIIDGIRDIPRIKLYSPYDGTALMASFTIEGMHTDQVAQALENEFSILCRAGIHCSPTAHLHLGTMPEGTVRLAPGYGNLDNEIEIAIRALKKIASKT
jgi:selenocysteine lyase/cysteine desulfurase